MFERHPYSAAMGDLEPDELKQLEQSLRTNGQLDDITLYQGKVLDGWHRFLMLQTLGLPPRTTVFHGTDAEARKLVKSRATGRSLTPAERIARFRALDAIESTSASAEAGFISKIRPRSQKEVADEAQVSRASVQRDAKVRRKGAPELVAAVEKGDVSLNDAVGVVELPPEKQVEALVTVQEAKANGTPITLRRAAGVSDNGHGNAAPVRNGKPHFDDRQITDGIAKLVRLIHERKSAHGYEAKHVVRAHEECVNAAELLLAAWKRWQVQTT